MVVAATPATDPYGYGPRVHLGLALRSWYQRTGDPPALDEAVDVLAPAVITAHENLALAQHTLGVVLRIRSDLTRDDHDLDMAIELLSNLGVALRMAATRSGDTSLMREAVDVGRQSVAASKPGRVPYALHLHGLAASLAGLFGRTGDEATLREAIDVALRSIADIPAEGFT